MLLSEQNLIVFIGIIYLICHLKKIDNLYCERIHVVKKMQMIFFFFAVIGFLFVVLSLILLRTSVVTSPPLSSPTNDGFALAVILHDLKRPKVAGRNFNRGTRFLLAPSHLTADQISFDC